MKWQKVFFVTALSHWGLTVVTGVLWTWLITARSIHRVPSASVVNASYHLFYPFSLPLFWPVEDWVGQFGHLRAITDPIGILLLVMIALVNSLSVSAVLLALAGLVQIVRSRRRQLPAI